MNIEQHKEIGMGIDNKHSLHFCWGTFFHVVWVRRLAKYTASQARIYLLIISLKIIEEARERRYVALERFR